MSHLLGFCTYSLSTLSYGSESCPKSYSKLCTNNCIGVNGKNGNTKLAIITDITSPKFELTAIFIYFNKLPKVFLPSITPSVKTFKFFLKRIISAVSFVISTAVSTETPTSALFNDGASFIPSPMYPTTFPAFPNTCTILDFCIGDNFANTLVFFNNRINAVSDNFSIWLPKTILSVFIPTSLHIALVTYSLSPVSTITRIPSLFNLFISSFALAFGGSKNPTKPISVIFVSSFTV